MHPVTKKSAAGFLIAIVIAIALSGCGQKGPLYLPDKTPPQQPPHSDLPTPTPTP